MIMTMEQRAGQMMIMVTMVIMVIMMGKVEAVTKPGGCSFDSGVFTCDYRFASGMDATVFDPPPQRLIVEEVDGTFSSTDMQKFNQVNTALFDINYPAELTIICITGGGGLLDLDSTSFTGMSFYNEIRIINCEFTSIAASAFANVGTVNHFSIEGGTINSIDANAFLGLNVVKDTAMPTPKGTFQMIDVDVVSAGLPSGIFSNLTQAEAITLSNCRLFTVELDLFSTTTSVSRVNLDNNAFTAIPDNLFKPLTALGKVSMGGISWECSCNNLWWLSHFQDNTIQLTSPATCTLPSSYYGKSVHTYYSDVCGAGLKCDGGSLPAVDLAGVTCLTVLQIVIYVFAIIGFFGGMAALAIAIQTKRQIGGAGGVNGPAKPGAGPRRGAGNRVSQRPPAGTRPPVKKNAFK